MGFCKQNVGINSANLQEHEKAVYTHTAISFNNTSYFMLILLVLIDLMLILIVLQFSSFQIQVYAL